MHYHFCGMLGHNLKHCATYFALTKNGGQVECECGEWLKASGRRPRSPTRRGTGMAQPPTEVHEMEESHREVVERVPVAECTKLEIPAMQERREKGSLKFQERFRMVTE